MTNLIMENIIVDITTDQLIELAEEFGLPCIERENSITVIGLVQLINFTKLEDRQCQLTEIY